MSPRLAQVIASTFQVSPESVTPNSGPDSIEKWDSAGHMNLLVGVEKEYGVQFDDDEVVELVSVEAVAEALKRHGAQP